MERLLCRKNTDLEDLVCEQEQENIPGLFQWQPAGKVPQHKVQDGDEYCAGNFREDGRRDEGDPAIGMRRSFPDLPVETCKEVPRKNDIDDGVAEEKDEEDAERPVMIQLVTLTRSDGT
jgi:hypothetical protein